MWRCPSVFVCLEGKCIGWHVNSALLSTSTLNQSHAEQSAPISAILCPSPFYSLGKIGRFDNTLHWYIQASTSLQALGIWQRQRNWLFRGHSVAERKVGVWKDGSQVLLDPVKMSVFPWGTSVRCIYIRTPIRASRLWTCTFTPRDHRSCLWRYPSSLP